VWRSLVIGFLALLAGMAYISGSALLLIMGVAYLAVNHRQILRDRIIRPHIPGLTVLAVGITTTIAQLYLVTRFQGSLLDSSSAAASVFPWDPRFWAFYVGAVGRSVGLSGGPVPPYVMVTAVVFVSPIVAWLFVRRDRHFTPWVGYVLLVAATVPPLYFAFVSFGRAGMLGDDESLSATLAFGGARFHFWWGAAMIPLVWLAWHAATGSLRPRFERAGFAILVIVTMILVVPKTLGGWRYPEAFAQRVLAFERNESCIASNVIAGQSDFVCKYSSSGNIGPRLALAYDNGFVFSEDSGLPAPPPYSE